MEQWKGKKRFFGFLLTAAAVLLFLTVFMQLSRKEQDLHFLTDTPEARFDWVYEKLGDGAVSETEPTFPDGGTACVEGKRVEGVRITRVMSETLEVPALWITTSGCGLEIFLDGEMLFSNVKGEVRGPEGMLRLTDAERAAIGEDEIVEITMPWEYSGGTLSVVTYPREPSETLWPVFPFLKDTVAEHLSLLADTVWPTAALTMYALLAILVLVLFATDMPGGAADVRSLLFALYYILRFLYEAWYSRVGIGSAAGPDLSILADLYAAPLFFYLALLLHGKKRWISLGFVSAWYVVGIVRSVVAWVNGEFFLLDPSGWGTMAILLLVVVCCAVEFGPGLRKRPPRALLSGAFLWLVIITAACAWNVGMRGRSAGEYFIELFMMVRDGYLVSAVDLLTDITVSLSVSALFSATLLRRMETQETVRVLEERSRLTLREYERMQHAVEATHALRHEIRHHMTALAGILREDGAERAGEYIASVMGEMNRLPELRYSENVLVNTIAGEYLDRARAEGIRVEHTVAVPAELGIADEDLSVFLTNLLENALLACERMDAGSDRFIRFQMHADHGALFIGCVNSTAAGESGAQPRKERTERHGYGLVAMRRIAEKYDSILKVDSSPGEFSVKTNLSMR